MFWIPQVESGKNLADKEEKPILTDIKAPIPSHIKVHIIDPSLAL